MNDKVNLAEKLSRFDDTWSPRIVAELNDYKVQVVKVQGEFVWHEHPDTDELFLVLVGRLDIRMRARTVRLDAGEMFVVPRGVEHCPWSEQGAEIVLIEPVGTPNTGSAGGGRTAPERRI